MNRPTHVVLPLDMPDAMPRDERHGSELDWCFEDAELTMQLRAIKRGRGLLVTTLLACVAAVGAGIALVV